MSEAQTPRWQSVADIYRHYDPPFLPTADDLAWVESTFAAAAGAYQSSAPLRGLILGVTPTLATLDWPTHTHVDGIDASAAMRDRVWPGDGPTPWGLRRAIVKPWETLREMPDTYHLACGDGSFNSFNSHESPSAFFEILRTALVRGGICALRTYLSPPAALSPAVIVDQFNRRVLSNPSIFKFLMYGALQPSFEQGIRVGDFYEYCAHLLATSADFRATAETHRDKWGVIAAAEGSAVVMRFLTLDHFRELAAPYLSVERVYQNASGTGSIAPVVVLRKAAD